MSLRADRSVVASALAPLLRRRARFGLTFLGLVLVSTALVAGAVAAGGELDPGFGSGGTVLTDFGDIDVASAVAVQPDGKIVVTGFLGAPHGGGFALARYNLDGSLDQSFGAGGLVRTDSGQAEALALQSDGKIVLAGTTGAGGFQLARFNTDGSLDASFGSGGTVVTSFGSFLFARALGVAIQPDGKLVAAGTAEVEMIGGESFVALARYNGDGSPDSTFGTGGRVLTDVGFGPGMAAGAVGVVIARDHAGGGLKIVAAVQVPSDIASNFDFALFRYDSDGSLDPSFGTDGKAVTDFGSGSDDVPAAVALEPNGRIVVAGESDAGGSFDFALDRYRPDGSLDTSFGTDGRVLTDFASGSGDDARALTLDLHGRIIAAGLSTAAGSLDFAVARYRGNGSLDASFGSDGKVLTDFGSNSRDFANGVAVEPDRKIVVVGLSTGADPGEFAGDFALARYAAN